MSDSHCPLCGQATAEPLALRSTGEFVAIGATAQPQPEPRRLTTAADLACSFCGKAPPEVQKVLGQPEARICNQCVGFCATVLQDELGDDWSR